MLGNKDDKGISTPDDDVVQTKADFGCVLWEAK